jgi:hypothetical protein
LHFPTIPHEEAARLNALNALNMLDTPREERFDRIVNFAAKAFGVPIALISLVDRDCNGSRRKWTLIHAARTALHPFAVVQFSRRKCLSFKTDARSAVFQKSLCDAVAIRTLLRRRTADFEQWQSGRHVVPDGY